jgi:uncharacterized LabA/DUF88 family protein
MKESRNSAYIVDGHHVFLECLKQVHDFLSLARNHEVRQLEPFLEEFLNRFETKTLESPLNSFSSALGAIDYADIALTDLLYPGFTLIPCANELELYWFDAPMPPIAEVKSKVRTRSPTQSAAGENIPDYDAMLGAKNWQFYKDKRHPNLTVPYDLKNEFIEEVKKWGFPGVLGEPEMGRREFYLSEKRTIISKEKEVDSSLVIKAIDLADRHDIDSVCFISADSDYYPAMKRLRERGKKVYFYTMSDYPIPRLQIA